MSEPEPRRGRAHDAKGAREAILKAAEAVFAEHGFDGARIDAIAKASGYNSSLLFQYFGDKLGLYAEVLKRANREIIELRARMLAPLLEDETIASNAHRFKACLETIVPQLNTEDLDRLEPLFHKVRSAGLLRSDFVPLVQLTMATQICQSYLAFLPLYQMFLPGEDLSSAAALARAREYIAAIVVAGMMVDLPETKP